MDNPWKLAARRRKQKQTKATKAKHTTICVGHHYAQINTNNENNKKNMSEPSYKQPKVFYAEIVTDITTWNSGCKNT